MNEKYTIYNSFIFFIIFIIFCLRFFLWYFVDLDLSFDEAQYYSWSKDIEWGYFSKPPFLAWLINFFTNICGTSEVCIRISSPILHSLIAVFIGLSASNLNKNADKKKIFIIASSIWLLIPAVSLSSGFISTDVPLLFFTSLILWIFSLIIMEKNLDNINKYILLLAIFFALGFLSKYAVLYLFIGIFLAIIFDKEIKNYLIYYFSYQRVILFISVFFILIFSHLLWNYENNFITAQHTLANVNIGGEWEGLLNLFKFFIEQFVVFGPITFTILLLLLLKYNEQSLHNRMLIFLTFTPIIIILIQAFMSRAHANWAAIAYVSGTILVAQYILKIWNSNGKKLFVINTLIGFFLMILIPTSGYYNFGIDPYKKNRGWSDLGSQVNEIYRVYPDAVLVADDRRVLAELLYYMDIKPKKWIRWNADGIIHDHYELITNHADLDSKIGLIVSSEVDNLHFKSSFEKTTFLKSLVRPMGSNKVREYKVWLLEGYEN